MVVKIAKHVSLALVCVAISTCGALAQSARLITKPREVPAFTSVQNNGAYNVQIRQGDACEVFITGPEGFHPYVQTIVNDSVLFIDVPDTKLRKLKKTSIVIILPELRYARHSGAGAMTFLPVNKASLRVDNDGGGSVTLIFSGDSLECRNSGVGVINVSGSVGGVRYINHGAGQIRAKEMKAKNVYVENDGIGGVDLYSSGELSVVNRGIGSVRYYGDGALKSVVDQGLGSVKKMSYTN